MIKRPLSIKIFSLIYVLLPLHIYAQMAYFSRYNFWEVDKVFSLFQLHSYVLSILWVVVGICIFLVKRWSFYVFLLHSISMIAWNIYFSWTHPRFPIELIIFFLFALFIITGFFILEPIRAPYFNPKMRWWEQEKRYRIDLSVILQNVDSNATFQGKTYDISKSGLFFVGEIAETIGEIVKIQIDQTELSPISLIGEIVWLSPGKGRYPQGCGIRFINLQKSQKKQIQKTIKDLLVRPR